MILRSWWCGDDIMLGEETVELRENTESLIGKGHATLVIRRLLSFCGASAFCLSLGWYLRLMMTHWNGFLQQSALYCRGKCSLKPVGQ